MRRAAIVVCLAMLPLLAANVRSEEVLDNAAVVRMVRAGLSAEVIELKVKGTAGRYDVSTDALIALKAAGVPDSVMAAMLKKNESAPAIPAATTTVPAAAVDPDADDVMPVCVKVTYSTAADSKAKWLPARVCVKADAFTVDKQRIPLTAVVAFCREKSLGFPYTSDPDEWWFGDGKQVYRVRGSQFEMSALDAAATSRIPAVPHGACSTRSIQRALAGQK